MKKNISKLFLYRYRFHIGYIILGIAFIALLLLMPRIAPNGLSQAEIDSAATSYNLHIETIATGDLVNLPYHVLQKFSIKYIGFNEYAIKLPSIIIGIILGFLLILLLNRWFKSNVALLASILTVLSVPFLWLAGSGSPLIMLVFWPTFLLWLGSKIQGVKKPRPLYCFVFAFALLLSLFTPHLPYLVFFIALFAFFNPHLRFTIKSLPKIPLIISAIVILGGVGLIIYNIFNRSDVIIELLFAKNFSLNQFLPNLKQAFTPYFSWNGHLESVYLSPLINLATVAIAIIGVLSTSRGFFASRNSIAFYFILFTAFLSGFNPDSAMLIVLPLAILVAHGLRYILEKWYGLFPENPYARVFGILPISIFLGLIIISDLAHYMEGYKYNPSVANQFNTDLSIINQHVENNKTLLIAADNPNLNFYKILEEKRNITIINSLTDLHNDEAYSLGKIEELPENVKLSQIITSPKTENSDRIYVYTVKSN
ncbi:glycosyltransferase family 39 protein [Candidatus Saccharibacteria bacterium]|nr:glycosyltransferase family 39 protein [Candidatus Saccharibacteria bacterium]